MQSEPNIFTCRDNTIRRDPTLQAAHPVGQHNLGCAAHLGEALAQHGQRGGGLLVAGEPYEPPPRPRQHGTENVDPALGAPVDDQVLTRGPHRRPAAAMVVDPPGLLGRCDQAAGGPIPPGAPQAMPRSPPGAHPAGRRPRWWSIRQAFLAAAARRRKFRSEPVYPAVRAAGSSRLAVIRPLDFFTRSATRSATTS